MSKNSTASSQIPKGILKANPTTPVNKVNNDKETKQPTATTAATNTCHPRFDEKNIKQTHDPDHEIDATKRAQYDKEFVKKSDVPRDSDSAD